MTKPIIVHFDSSGMQSYPEPRFNGYKTKEITEFEMTFKIKESYRGRSTSGIMLYDKNDKRWPMSIGQVLIMLKNTTIKDGMVHGIWTVIKRGANYSLSFLRESDVKRQADNLKYNQINKLKQDMRMVLPILEKVFDDPVLCDRLTAGTGVATLNGFKKRLSE